MEDQRVPDLPKILERRQVAESRLFRIEELDLEFSNGQRARYERVLGTGEGAVMVVAMPDPATVLLVREYAAGVDRYELGLPKGRIEPGEEPLATANRELMEETGYAARKLRELGTLSIAPGYIGHSTRLILARDLYRQRETGDEPEPIEGVPWPLAAIRELFDSGECSEARSIAALYLTREYLNHESD